MVYADIELCMILVLIFATPKIRCATPSLGSPALNILGYGREAYKHRISVHRIANTTVILTL